MLKVSPCGGLVVSGAIVTENGKPVGNAVVQFSGTESGSAGTLADGSYNFSAVTNGNYTITPSRNSDVTVVNGVSSLDMVMIQGHILNMQPLATPYKIIAADVNGSGTVSTLDIVLMRAFILGVATSFPGNKLWQFVNSDYVFPNPANPFPYENSRVLSNVSQSQPNQNFIGIKLGDVNGSWNENIP